VGFSIQEKVFVSGFSAGGMWANRYTLLHPEMVKAAAIGQSGGWLAMPITNYNGINLRWPLGLYNYSELTGEEYSKYDLLKNVPMFIYIGDQDNNSTYSSHYPSRDLITIWGSTDPLRLENQYNYLKNLGFNVTFKLYPNVGHHSDPMVNDVIKFIIENSDE
jgi:predicted esterase